MQDNGRQMLQLIAAVTLLNRSGKGGEVRLRTHLFDASFSICLLHIPCDKILKRGSKEGWKNAFLWLYSYVSIHYGHCFQYKPTSPKNKCAKPNLCFVKTHSRTYWRALTKELLVRSKESAKCAARTQQTEAKRRERIAQDDQVHGDNYRQNNVALLA